MKWTIRAIINVIQSNSKTSKLSAIIIIISKENKYKTITYIFLY
jgi:hypothetical protein